MVGASAVLGLGLHAATPMAPFAAGLLGIAIGTAFGYGKPVWRIAGAVAASVPFFALKLTAPMLAAIAMVMALALVLETTAPASAPSNRASLVRLRGLRGLCALLLGSATVLLAIWAAWRIGHARQTIHWSGWTRDTAAAAAMGMIGVFSVLPRHLRLSLDPIQSALRGLPADMDSEMRELCMRSVAIWTTAKDKLAEDDPGKNLVRDGVLKTLEVAAKSADVKVAGATEDELAKRMTDLDQRIVSASDDEVKTQYQSARAALEDQRRYRDHIKQNRERLIARMHNHVAALEKFQLAASGLVAARAATSGASAVKQLEELSHDVAASGEALAELELVTAQPVASEAAASSMSKEAPATEASTSEAPATAAPATEASAT